MIRFVEVWTQRGFGTGENHLGVTGIEVMVDSAGGYEPGSPREMTSCNLGPDPGARKYAGHGALGWRPAKMT